MGVSIKIVGVATIDDEYKKMRKIFDLCKELEIEAPDEVVEYFAGSFINDGDDLIKEGEGIWLTSGKESCLTKTDDGAYLIQLNKVPERIKFIRVSLSW